MSRSAAKLIGQFYSPEGVASTLVNWLAPSATDRLLDPSCGDGRFISLHRNSVGVDVSAISCVQARLRAPWATIHESNFFEWAKGTSERFDCIAGNPPFIRYHNFSGTLRRQALELCAQNGAKFSALTSSWAPFLVVAAGLLRPGGKMAFVVPAEIGHANYSATLLDFLITHFERVVVVAIKEKIFSDLSEDVWLLFATGKGGKARFVELAALEKFVASPSLPANMKKISVRALRENRMRLRRFILPDSILDYYANLPEKGRVVDFGSIARIGIGYVTGANDFFHLRPSEAKRLRIPDSLLKVSVRKGDQLRSRHVDSKCVESWIQADEPVMLLDLNGLKSLPSAVRNYLDSEAGRGAKRTYKCSNREPWYAVPDVFEPDAFLSYMSGKRPHLVGNRAGCVCTNSVHAVRLKRRMSLDRLVQAWEHPVCSLSIELEGHPLGGGLLKIEPGEANRILLVLGEDPKNNYDYELLKRGIDIAQSWRHCA
ncbi:MAG: hypothetical protein ND895_28585 [Pyrinomonadaceae bacterium]|nr:hypothetical protein [Pyrinomonadaceae bacterium]